MPWSGIVDTAGLRDAAEWMTPSEQALVRVLIENDQSHLFASWKEHQDVEKKHRFFDQVRALEGGYPGGVAAYLRNARDLLRSSAAGDNPFEGMRPEVPTGVSLDYGTPDFVQAEEIGLHVLKDCCFVLVAGGLGERLGYTNIKVQLPVETVTERCYLELYIQQILALQERSMKLEGSLAPQNPPPLAIMTSDDTHARTVDLLTSHNNFGMPEGQIAIVKQEKVAALIDNDAHMALDENDHYTLDTKPHGHGDVHTLLASSGLARRWANEGKKYVIFFQDTNSLAFTVTPAAVGVSEQFDFEVNSVTVPRKAKDAVGAITKLVRNDGSSITVNVEYNQLEPLLKASGHAEGDVNDPATGFSTYPGNINQLIFKLQPYSQVLEQTGGLVPEFVNPKYADAAKNKFKKPTRLECMMQDHPKVLGPSSKVGFTNFPEWTYLPVKNSVDEARSKIAVGVPGRTAAEGELDYYAAACRQLASVGVAIPPHRSFQVFGFGLTYPPKVILHPSFASTFTELKGRFPHPGQVQISARSTLYLEGDVTVESIKLDGALIVRATRGARVTIRRITVVNEGYELAALTPEETNTVPASTRIRGFKIDRREARTLVFDKAGDYVVDESSP